MFGLLAVLLIAIASAALLPGIQAFSQYRRQQILLFGIASQHVEARARNLSVRLTQFGDTLQARWRMAERPAVPLQRYRKLLAGGGGVAVSGADLTTLPCSIVTTLTGPGDAERLASMLQMVRELSLQSLFDGDGLGLALSAELIATDGTFSAAVPPLPAASLAKVRQVGARGFIATRAMLADVPPVGAPLGGAAGRPPVWLRESGAHGSSGISGGASRAPGVRIMLPIMRDGVPVATLLLRLTREQFERYFIAGSPGGPMPHLFVFDALTAKLIGASGADDHGELRKLVADRVRLGPATSASASVGQYRDGVVIITQRIAEPDWIVVSAFDWQDALGNQPRHDMIRSSLQLASILAMWVIARRFNRYLHQPPHPGVSDPGAARATRAAPPGHEAADATCLVGSILDALPVGVMVHALPDGEVMIGNASAAALLDSARADAGRQLFERIESERVREPAARGRANPGGSVEIDWARRDGRLRKLSVAWSVARFLGRDVMLLALTETGGRGEPGGEPDRAAPPARPSLLAMMSHEVRTPLHGAIGNLELLARSALEAEQHERIGTIRRTLDDLLLLVDDMLDMTSMEGHALPLQLAPVRLNELVEHCVRIFAPTIHGRGVALHCLVDPALDVPAEADSRRLAQVLQNLLGNAAKFTQRGEIVVSAQILGEAAGRTRVYFEIGDTGIGIPASLQAIVFEPLRQADESIGRRFGGSGLGLFLCRRLVELMGGHMTLTSEPGKGSVFGVELPLLLLDAPPRPRPLAGVNVEIVCERPRWHELLVRRIEAWGGTPFDARRDGARPMLCLMADAAGRDGAMVPVLGTVRMAPDGPLVPRRAGTRVDVTALSGGALLAALTLLTGDAAPGPAASAGSVAAPRSPPVPCPPQASQPWPAPVAMLAPAAGQAAMASLEILVVEDDPVGRTLIEQQLATLGVARVCVIGDGRQALDAWCARRPDLIITDVDVPGLDGIALLAALRERDAEAIVVAMTAFAPRELDSGAQCFSHLLRKPASLDDLRRVLDHVCCTIGRGGRSRSSVCEARAGEGEEGAAQSGPDAGDRRADSLQLALRDTFVENCRTTRAALVQALAAADRAGLKRCLHRLQGALSIMGYDALAQQCTTLRSRCERGSWTVLEQGCHALIAELLRLAQELHDAHD